MRGTNEGSLGVIFEEIPERLHESSPDEVAEEFPGDNLGKILEKFWHKNLMKSLSES